ncbi:MAG: hypothetical protein ACUVQX_01745 [Candidatus Bathycorpusculaceae bacterium]
MVIPAPMKVDEIIRTVPEGKFIAINEIRALLARKHKATNWKAGRTATNNPLQTC